MEKFETPIDFTLPGEKKYHECVTINTVWSSDYELISITCIEQFLHFKIKSQRMWDSLRAAKLPLYIRHI